jgi:hypothetical protein
MSPICFGAAGLFGVKITLLTEGLIGKKAAGLDVITLDGWNSTCLNMCLFSSRRVFVGAGPLLARNMLMVKLSFLC